MELINNQISHMKLANFSFWIAERNGKSCRYILKCLHQFNGKKWMTTNALEENNNTWYKEETNIECYKTDCQQNLKFSKE